MTSIGDGLDGCRERAEALFSTFDAARRDAARAMTGAIARGDDGTYYVTHVDAGGGRAVTETWRVGHRYELTRLLGVGSFGAVCEARDATHGGVRAAVKRISNVLHSERDARKVLREIVALHRTNHPNVCTLRRAFYEESDEGAKKLDATTMKLRAVSIDVYLSFEYAEGGDIFALRGQLSAKEVVGLMQQACEATRYLHSVGIWHRDIKSANTLLGKHRHGGRVIKLCDFGSARGALGGALEDETEANCGPKRRRMATSALSARVDDGALTKFVMTPCYRAPEVIMGGIAYTGAVDVWALGCIFAELLQRQVSSNLGALNQKLTVKPLFSFEDTALASPPTGEQYDDNNCDESAEQRRSQLDTLFNVIGTPGWAEIERIKSPHWREYLRSLPGRAGSLDTLFHHGVDADARDLLRRMLQFDPSMRASCEEILAHRYFASSTLATESIKASTDSLNEEAMRGVEAMKMDVAGEPRKEFWEIDHPGLALEELEKAFARVHEQAKEKGADAWRDEYRAFFEKECARSERFPATDSNEVTATDKSLLALFPDFFRGEGPVEYKLDSNADERDVVHQYGFADGGSWEAHLNRDRMGEWTTEDWDTKRTLDASAPRRGVWGVTAAPPGGATSDAVQSQQGR